MRFSIGLPIGFRPVSAHLITVGSGMAKNPVGHSLGPVLKDVLPAVYCDRVFVAILIRHSEELGAKIMVSQTDSLVYYMSQFMRCRCL